VPEIRLQQTLRVPTEPTHQALGELLHAIAGQEGPWRGFALHIGLGDLRLPDFGYVAIPIQLTVSGDPAKKQAFDITFRAISHPGAFPTFAGTIGLEPHGLGESLLCLNGKYDVPLQMVGKLLDVALTPGVAQKSLENFLHEIGAACTARVDQREAEFARYRFYLR
jgi:hypothetical protein